MNKFLKVKCPQCDTNFSYYESEFRPFCSDRCQKIDLGHWFKESYTVPSKETTLDAEKEIDVDDNEADSSSEYEH
ncbi:MAG: DNA gyrase inhibitor YacG [Bacteriovorax sp.]|nr:DNA gyrase inhibitor YacG [Bacteriovorax sp.]